MINDVEWMNKIYFSKSPQWKQESPLKPLFTPSKQTLNLHLPQSPCTWEEIDQ